MSVTDTSLLWGAITGIPAPQIPIIEEPKPKKKKKKTWNSSEKENVKGVLNTEQIKKYKEEANEVPKEFLKLVYNDPDYLKWSDSKKIKRGDGAKNWKVDGDKKKDFVCPTLHYVDNVYLTMSQRVSKARKKQSK